MRTIFSLIIAFVTGLFTIAAQAQVQWIADAGFGSAPYASLYKMLEDGKPLVIAVGDINSQTSERLLGSGALQKLTAEHDAGAYGQRFSAKDLHIAFVNVQVMDQEAEADLPKGIQFIHMNEGDDALNGAGWQGLYSIAGTHLFLITSDHLVRPLHGSSADEISREVFFFNSRIRPTATPDVRLLDATLGAGRVAQIRVQNFSTSPLKEVQISVLKDGQPVAEAIYSAPIASLEDAVITLDLPEGDEAGFTIVAKTAGDTNQMNNRWTGALRASSDMAMIAGTIGK